MTMQELLALGQGASLVPDMAARADKTKRILYRPLSGPKPSRTLAMIRHKHRYMSPLVQGLVGVFRAEAKLIDGHTTKQGRQRRKAGDSRVSPSLPVR
jgi:DNA-binding transcriptional LysR family regulator